MYACRRVSSYYLGNAIGVRTVHTTTSVRRTLKRVGLRFGLSAAVIALSAGLVASPVAAESAKVGAIRNKVAKNKEQQQEAQKNVDNSKNALNKAEDKLKKSQSELDAAKTQLANLKSQLSQAQARDAQLAKDLVSAQAALAKAQREVTDNQSKVDEQKRVMGQAAREAYQKQRNPLVGISVVLGKEGTSNLSQRIQWSETIFDSTSADKARLDALQKQLEAARDRQATIEATIAKNKADAAATVRLIASLTAQAQQQEISVASLVKTNEANRQAAQKALAEDEKTYRQLQREEAALEKAIREQIAKEVEEARRAAEARRKAEDARKRAEEARKKAEEAERRAAREKTKQSQEAAKKAREEAKKAERESAARKSTNTVSRTTRQSSKGFIRPINANPGSPFGMRFHPILKYWRMHNGTDFGAACGTPLYAARDGKVLMARYNGGFGNYVLIGHGTVAGAYTTTGYAHLSRYAVRAGQQVKQGQIIGYVGTTGLSTGCHLHFEVRRNGTPVNPMNWIP